MHALLSIIGMYVLSMYVVHLSALSILNCPFFYPKDVTETKIDAAADKRAPGVPRAGVPWRVTSGKTLIHFFSTFG